MLVGAVPRRMRPPHLPVWPSGVAVVVESVTTTLGSLRADSARIVVIVMGEDAVPAALIVAPFSMTIAGATPPRSGGKA